MQNFNEITHNNDFEMFDFNLFSSRYFFVYAFDSIHCINIIFSSYRENEQ